ncbi:histone deacetylase family protein [Bradyrhizobium septentrionale]|uniref:Histone deacetylase family protein n=1 Tax=Bradyrhizobium septentrionale TaxID=1404411 RepID=A0A974A132_9BRAD|nr:histone deacetylase family protein [Bradyrhizobium septentrionale]UGY13450.1 histone deacetylase family protein [Bradyrhizobium septentrionale]UGY22091.1 histone deacetylase family protein [Bradyrhizobium septentrionale]
MKAVYTELHRSHDPQFFLVRGVVTRTTEQPERADRLLAGLRAGEHTLVAPTAFGQGPRARVHSPEYLSFLAEAWDAWSALGDSGPEMIANMHPVRNAGTYPTHIVGKLGWHTIDTSCPIGPGTWAAACSATDVATTAAQMVMDGEDAVYALCRPPGHHAYRDLASGFCFLNNSAIAAAHLRLKHERVAILDVDVHHGNGTQGIFYERSDVLTVSIHADPTFFNPFVWGYAHERGAGSGLGANLNVPLAIGTGDDGYIQALVTAEKMIRAFEPGALVVALGLDASEHDPLAGLAVTTGGFGRIGSAIARLGLPTVLVQEGGYLSDILGKNLTSVLAGFEAVR